MIEIPKVSIVVAAYNVAPFLSRCMDSVLCQTAESLEVILVDDGSTDETPSIADCYALSDPRVVVIHRQNGGLSEARNTGLRAAKGEFVCFLDSDDWVEPDMIRSMITPCELAGSTVTMAGVWVDFHDDQDTLIRSERRLLPPNLIQRGVPLDPHFLDDDFVNLMGYAWNKIYRREWLTGLGIEFEAGLSLIEDIDFNAKVLAAADRVNVIPEAFVHYVQRPRKTLGNTHDESYLTLRMRAIDSVNSLLEVWGVDHMKRIERSTNAGGLALWATLRSAAMSLRPRDQLRRMLEQPGVDAFVAATWATPPADWRGRWAAATLRRRWYSLALMPIRASYFAKTLTARRSRKAATLRIARGSNF